MDALVNSLGAKERDLLRETETDRMAELDEDALVELHKRIRRARNKYVGIYRREGAAMVSQKGGRGLGAKKNTRNADRAEAFEDALARVSAQLAAAASAAAEELKATRLAAARKPAGGRRGTKAAAPGSDPAKPDPVKPDPVKPDPVKPARVSDRTPTGPGRQKRNASTRAQGARRQATRDSR